MKQLTRYDLKILLEKVPMRKNASIWSKGVLQYAWDLVGTLDDTYVFEVNQPIALLNEELKNLKKILLNGADNWHDYSYGGNAYIYDEDIAGALCTPYEYRKTKGGTKQPNKDETWLDVQARALYQAWLQIQNVIRTEWLNN